MQSSGLVCLALKLLVSSRSSSYLAARLSISCVSITWETLIMLAESHSFHLAVKKGLETSESDVTGLRDKLNANRKISTVLWLTQRYNWFLSLSRQKGVGNSKGTVTKKKTACYRKGITSFFCLEAAHACALPHHLVTRVVGTQNYTKIIMLGKFTVITEKYGIGVTRVPHWSSDRLWHLTHFIWQLI